MCCKLKDGVVMYAEILKNAIDGSGKNQKIISLECQKYGVRINDSYISKLKNGKSAPPSEKVSVALARSTGCSPAKLALAGLIEKITREHPGILNPKDIETALQELRSEHIHNGFTARI